MRTVHMDPIQLSAFFWTLVPMQGGGIAMVNSAILFACYNGHLSTVQLLINHDNSLLELGDSDGFTPLFVAVGKHHSDIVRFLLDSGANARHVDPHGSTALMYACQFDNLEIVRLLLAAGVDVDARNERPETALQHAAFKGAIEAVRELILQHNANMFAVERDGRTLFDDLACNRLWSSGADAKTLLEVYGNKSTQDHGRLALHKLLKVAKYSFFEDHGFHPPLNPLRIILPLGKLKLEHWHTLLHALDTDLIRNRDNRGKLPIHFACRTSAPVEVLAMLVEMDPATLHITDSTGTLPIHLLCGTTPAIEYASVRYLIEQGGVGTLAARDLRGLLPLHVLCESTNPPLRAVQYLMQSFPVSLAMRTNAGQYPFVMAAAADSFSASLSVIYELVRANPGLVIQRLGTFVLTNLRRLMHTLDMGWFAPGMTHWKVADFILLVPDKSSRGGLLVFSLELGPATLHIADFTGILPIHLLCFSFPQGNGRGGCAVGSVRQDLGALGQYFFMHISSPIVPQKGERRGFLILMAVVNKPHKVVAGGAKEEWRQRQHWKYFSRDSTHSRDILSCRSINNRTLPPQSLVTTLPLSCCRCILISIAAQVQTWLCPTDSNLCL